MRPLDEPIPRHRLFGMTWMDFLHGLPVVVEMEKDLSVQQQRLDVLILRREPGPLPVTMPDGFEDFGPHNLITFKSYQEALDGWAMDELVGHYVSYRKLVSPSPDDLLPETEFRRYAVCVREPTGLAGDVPLGEVREGVYEARHFSGAIRVIVVNQLPRLGQNAWLHLFSSRSESLVYGERNHQLRAPNTSSLLGRLFQRHLRGGMIVADVLEEMARQYLKDAFAKATPEERLELVKNASPEERLKGLSVDELLAALPPETRASLVQKIKETDPG